MKIYKAIRERIENNIEIADGSNTSELYALERKINDAIKKVIEWREKHFYEKYWEKALPQTLLNILEGWDHNASKVAARCFLEVSEINGEGITEEVKE